MEGKKRQTSDEKGIRIISVAAFAFAIVSWKATAEGLDAYVFDHGWQSALISFAIQSILFVFNLKLPFYISHIGEIAEERKRRKCHFGDNKGNEKKTYKLTGLQRVIIVFYAVILASSSFFSFVYICNDVVYKHQSGYVDDNAILFSQYREILNDTDDYIRENKKAMQILASIHLGELQQEYPTENNEDGKSLQDLESSRKLAEELFDSAEEEYQNAKDDADKLQEVVQGYEKQRNGTRWHNKQEEWETKYEIANDKWNEAIAKRDKKQEKCDDAKEKIFRS